jgi:toxin ParE1/3/4
VKRYRLTPQAVEDLHEIAEFIGAHNKGAARKLIDAIKSRCQALAGPPEMGRARDELAPGLRSSVVGKYVIFYRVGPKKRDVEVIRIVHGARDLPRLFGSAED